MATRIWQGMGAPLSKLLFSVFLSLHGAALQCFSAHAQTDWESHSKFELTRNINSLHHRHIHVFLQALFALGTKVSFNANENEFLTTPKT